MNQRQIDRTMNENGEGYSLAADQADQRAQASLLAMKDAFAAEWTAEVTAARRAAWNAEMAKLAAAKIAMTSKAQLAIQARLGYTLADIKRAIALHA
jgi:hypothetical protein